LRDFTLTIYKYLLNTLRERGYPFYRVDRAPEPDGAPFIILRHDVDRSPQNALRMAGMEADLGIRSSYYFRAVARSFDESVIREISRMNHEVGYHYENLAYIARGRRLGQFADGGSPEDLYEQALEDFKKNLEKFRQSAPVKTICMHGSPMSRYDGRDLWKKYDYRDFGIEREPYFDFDFSKIFYMTDTGRRWDGDRVSVRDRVDVKGKKWPVYRTSLDIISAVKAGTFPGQAMITVHPQRWTNHPVSWMKELIWQNSKNAVKRFFIWRREKCLNQGE